jgi:hypothetical protein
VNSELERMCKEQVEALSRHLPGWSMENYENPQSG